MLQHICELSARISPQLTCKMLCVFVCVCACVRMCACMCASVHVCVREREAQDICELSARNNRLPKDIVCVWVCVFVCAYVARYYIFVCTFGMHVCIYIPRIISWNFALSNSPVLVRCLPEILKRQCPSISDIRNYHKGNFTEILLSHFRL